MHSYKQKRCNDLQVLNLPQSSDSAVLNKFHLQMIHNVPQRAFCLLDNCVKINWKLIWGPLWIYSTPTHMASCALNELAQAELPPIQGNLDLLSPGLHNVSASWWVSAAPACMCTCTFLGACTLERAHVCLFDRVVVHVWIFICACTSRLVYRLLVGVRLFFYLFFFFLLQYVVQCTYLAHLWDGLLNGNERDLIHESLMQISQW